MKLSIKDKILWIALQLSFIFGLIIDSSSLQAVGVLGLIMMSLWIDLAERIESIKKAP